MDKKEKRLQEIRDKKYSLIKCEDNFIDYSDEQGYKYHNNIYNKGKLNTSHKFDIKNPYAIHNINLALQEGNEFKTILIEDSFRGGKEFMWFKCGRCGKTFKGLLGNVLKYKYKICYDCVREIQETKLQNIEDIRRRVEKCGYILLDEKWTGNHVRVNVQDYKGYKGQAKLETLESGGSFNRFWEHNPYVLENLRHFVKLKALDETIPHQKIKGKTVKVKKGNEIKQCRISKLIEKKELCFSNELNTGSLLEEVVFNWLMDNHIKFVTQKTYADCKDTNRLKFDFYIGDKNTLIEVQGKQHSTPIEYFGGKEKFKDQVRKDNIKKEFCKRHNISLIELSYKCIQNNDYKRILDKKLNN